MSSAVFRHRVIKIGLWLAAVRIGVLWYLQIRHTMGRETLEEIPLILLLYPEGLLLPRNYSLTTSHVVGFSGLLLAGSLLIAVVLVLLYGMTERAQLRRS